MTGQILSPIAFDMGAAHTGIFSFTQRAGEALRPEDRHFYTIVLPQESSQFTYSMQGRTAKRHQVRGYKRFKLARRLLSVLIKTLLKARKIEISDEERKRLAEALSGLLKRRGYSRVEVEADTSSLNEADPQIFAEILPDFFDGFSNLAGQWERMKQDLGQVRRLLDAMSKLDKNPFKGKDKEAVQPAKEALKAIKEAASEAVNMTAMGHRPRSVYFNEILHEIMEDSRLAPAVQAAGSEERLRNLVGNVSNLQERAGRWYFDRKDKQEFFFFDEAHLKRTLIRAFKFFHPESERRPAFGRLIKALEESEDVIETLCTMDPNETIPPYEDQNNRRPPKDLTLLLNPRALNARYGKWRIWVQNLLERESFMADSLDVILAKNDRVSARPSPANGWKIPQGYSQEEKRDAYVLQRFLDRSKSLDSYALRLISRKKPCSKSSDAVMARQKLEAVLGSQHVEAFLDMAARYYAEADAAKSGLWNKEPDSLLERSDLHPSMLEKVRGDLISGILGKTVSLEAFSDLWKMKMSGRLTVCGACRKIEEARKSRGNAFKLDLSRAQAQQRRNVKLSKDEAGLLQILDLVEKTSDFIAKELSISSEAKAKFANSFSLAQLFNLVEGDSHGFTSTCQAVHQENLWRMSTAYSGDGKAICSRLPADSVRPFDGVLRRVLDRCAWEAAKVKAQEIKSSGLKNAEVKVVCIAEQNRFAYSASLSEIKNQKGKKLAQAQDRMKKSAERQERQWEEKWSRIRNDNPGICPYIRDPEENIGDHWEYDHIIPRSFSQKMSDTIYNTEINLIYCSQKGNYEKGNNLYCLENLNPRYLKAVFGTADLEAIKSKITQTVRAIGQLPGRIFLDLLTEEQRQALRHALFLDQNCEARQKAMELLSSRLSTLVNGSQGWFIKVFKLKLQSELSQWCKESNCTLAFAAREIPAKEGSALRWSLAEVSPESRKEDRQSAASHGIDALCAYAVATLDPRLGKDLESLQREDLIDPEDLKKWLPESYEVIRVEQKPGVQKTNLSSRSLYKDTIYGEHFIPIYAFRGRLWIGFNLPSAQQSSTSRALEVTGEGKEDLIKLLRPFLKEDVSDSQSKAAVYHVDKVKAFEFLSDVNKRKATESEKDKAYILNRLRYFTTKIDIEKEICDANGKTSNPEKWRVKGVEIEVNCELKKKKFKCHGKIEAPFADDWRKLFSNEELRNEHERDKQREVLKKIFHAGLKRSHKATRRVFSLPIIKGPSGGFRIRRKTNQGAPVFQVQAANAHVSGFELDASRGIIWKNQTILSAFSTKNVTPLDENKNKAVDGKYVPVDHWGVIAEEAGVRLEMCPATGNRPYLRISQPKEDFFKSYNALTGFKVKSILQILPDFKKIGSDEDFKNTFPESISKLVSPPRTFVKVLRLGETVVYQFNARDAYSAKQKEQYQKSLDSELK